MDIKFSLKNISCLAIHTHNRIMVYYHIAGKLGGGPEKFDKVGESSIHESPIKPYKLLLPSD